MNLRSVHAPGPGVERERAQGDALSATIVVDGIEPLFLAYDAAGVTWHRRLRREPWGARTFIVRDPDGNLIAFAGN